jgi:hypothetical protein
VVPVVKGAEDVRSLPDVDRLELATPVPVEFGEPNSFQPRNVATLQGGPAVID